MSHRPRCAKTPPTSSTEHNDRRLLEERYDSLGREKKRSKRTSRYFLNPTIDKLQFERLPEQFDEPVSRGASRLLDKYLSKYAVYKLSGDQIGTRAAKAILKSVTVENGELVVVLGI